MKTIIIFFDEKKTCMQVIKPSAEFDTRRMNCYQELVDNITNGHYHSFEIK